MHWVKTLNKKTIIWLLVFVILFLITRLPQLGFDTINPDAVNWHYRSEQFVVGLKHQIFSKTYQHYHPGVSLMWLTGIPIEIFKQIINITLYDQFSFYAFHFIAKYSLVLVQLVLSILIIYWLTKVIGFKKSLLVVFVMSMEPFIVGNSRLYHMDLIFMLFIFSSLLLSYLYIKTDDKTYGLICGLFLAASFLTRSIGVGAYLFTIIVGGSFLYYTRRDFRKVLKYVLVITLPFLAATFLFFPALWDKPWEVLKDIFSEGSRIGVRKGHSQIFFGELTKDPGIFFYPLVILMKTSPFLLGGVLLYLLNFIRSFSKMNLKEKAKRLFIYLAIFYLGYFLVMTFPAKKLDRYMIVLFPILGIMAVFGYCRLLKVYHSHKNLKLLFLIIFMVYVIWPVIKLHPYQFTYTSPLFGNSQQANKIIAQKSFGIGIFEVKKHLQENYGSQVKVGFIDTKPIRSIYPNSLVSDIRISGTGDYKILVLAVNEEIPEKVLKSEVKFIQDSSIFINGLEYWRFYVKQDK